MSNKDKEIFEFTLKGYGDSDGDDTPDVRVRATLFGWVVQDNTDPEDPPINLPLADAMRLFGWLMRQAANMLGLGKKK